jgi:hypothetical protein
MPHGRTRLQQEVVEALIKSKAIDFEAVGAVMSKFGERAALAGDSLGSVINWRLHDVCIPPFTLGDGAIDLGPQIVTPTEE